MAMIRTTVVLAAGLALAAGMTGCRVNVEKGANGEDKNVQVDTPFGGVHVNTNQTTASDLGLPMYPGAQAVADDDKHKSADVHLGFGEWQLRVRAANYETTDSKEQVTAFYKKALGRYGDVLTCEDGSPVGTPNRTSEGLTCEESQHTKVQINQGDWSNNKSGLQLKAGSKRHQHIVGFEKSKNGKTRFALVALDLPAAVEKDSDKSD
jgi:hypothetical protein